MAETHTPMAGCFCTPRRPYLSGFRPGDCFLELTNQTVSGGVDTITMGTATSLITHASWGFGVNRADGGACAVYTDGTAEIPGTSYSFYGANEEYDIYTIGGVGGSPLCFSMASAHDVHHPGTVYWELVKLGMDSGSCSLTPATELDYISRPLYVLPTEIKAAAPDTTGAYVSVLSSVLITVVCGAGSESVFALIGGFVEGIAGDEYPYTSRTIPDDSGTDKDIRQQPVYLGNAFHRKPGDLIGEIVTVKLGGESPATEPIVASTHCQFITHILGVLPMANKNAGLAVSWSGTQGASTAIYSANAATQKVACLVLGR